MGIRGSFVKISWSNYYIQLYLVYEFKKAKKFLQEIPPYTTIHLQWLCANNNNVENFIKDEITGIVVLDIGCATKWPAKLLPFSNYYGGIDRLETAGNWYKTLPDVYGDAQNNQLPAAVWFRYWKRIIFWKLVGKCCNY